GTAQVGVLPNNFVAPGATSDLGERPPLERPAPLVDPWVPMNAVQGRRAQELPAPAALTDLPGIGPARARSLASPRLRSPRDLLLCVPSAAREAALLVPVARALLASGTDVRVRGKIERVVLQRFRGRSTVRVRLGDGSGAILALYFNQPWMAKGFTVGE